MVSCVHVLLPQVSSNVNRTLGYFINDDKKIKEKGVKMTFGPPDGATKKSAVTGGGTNEYGAFTVKGEYDQSTKTLQCTKKYIVDDDEDDDADFEAAEPAEEGEALALADEANMPIEELMKRYGRAPDGSSLGGGGDEPAEPPAKKQKVVEEEEQYDEF